MVNSILKWTACVVICVGAALTTFRIDPWNLVFLNLGAVLYASWGYRVREWNQVVVNVFLILLYAGGFLIRG